MIAAKRRIAPKRPAAQARRAFPFRPAGESHADQARVVTPADAIAAGSTYLVVGRPITQAPDPAAAAKAILADMRPRAHSS